MICYALRSTVASLRESYDITHFHATGPSTMSLIPKLFGRRTVVTVQGLDWQRGKWGPCARAYLKLGVWSSRRIPHRTIVVSKTLKQYYESKCEKEVSYIPNGINGSRFAPLGEAGERFSIQRNRYLLFVGRLAREKNVHLLIRAFRKLDTDLKLVIVGGSSHTNGYVDELRQLAGSNNQIVLTGPIYDHLLPQIYSNAYLFVLPSALEGLPVALLEALSYGIPVLVSDIPENMETINDEGAPRGFSFGAGQVESLRTVIGDLIENPDKVEKMRASGREFVARKYNWDRITDQTLEVYRSAIRGRRPAARRSPLAPVRMHK